MWRKSGLRGSGEKCSKRNDTAQQPGPGCRGVGKTELAPVCCRTLFSGFLSTQHKRAHCGIIVKRLDIGRAGTKQGFDLGGRTVPQLKPDHLRRLAP